MTTECQPANVLLISYTQTGATAEIAQAFVAPLESRGVHVTRETIAPQTAYPFPWKSIGRFFDVMPECVLGIPPEIVTPTFDESRGFDVVVIFYQVWFLSPSLPMLGFLAHPKAEVLRNKQVITVVVSRNMWTSASEIMKRLLQERGAVHRDNVSVTHQGPIWATFVTIPRLLLYGKRDRLWNVFPPPGVAAEQCNRLAAYGKTLADALCCPLGSRSGPWFTGMGAAEIQERYLLPEVLGRRIFWGWAHVLMALGKVGGKSVRRLGTHCFVLTLVCLIIVGIPLLFVSRILLYPFLQPWLNRYVSTLRQPSDPPRFHSDAGGDAGLLLPGKQMRFRQ